MRDLTGNQQAGLVLGNTPDNHSFVCLLENGVDGGSLSSITLIPDKRSLSQAMVRQFLQL